MFPRFGCSVTAAGKGEALTCTNYRMEHPHRLYRDEFGVMVSSLRANLWYFRQVLFAFRLTRLILVRLNKSNDIGKKNEMTLLFRTLPNSWIEQRRWTWRTEQSRRCDVMFAS